MSTKMCSACEEGRHLDCGLQTWCECDCEGSGGDYDYYDAMYDNEKINESLNDSEDNARDNPPATDQVGKRWA